MKKIAMIIVVVLSLFSFQLTGQAAEEAPKFLDKADISVTSNGGSDYDIKQVISLKGEGDFSSNQVEHTFSHINGITADNVAFTFNGEALSFTTEEDESLTRYFITIPEGVSDQFDYEISYTLTVESGDFSTPLFVPMHAAHGEENVVKIDFTTTEENIVQRHSFPVLKKAEDNQVTSYLMNIPSHVSYIFGPEKSFFNSHTIISWASILILLAIVFVWIRSELKKSKVPPATNNGKGVTN